MKRILLFILTNIAILAAITIVTRLLGVDHWLYANGISYTELLGFSLVCGFTGSFISLAMSKWMAKMAYQIQVIEKPSSEAEQWLVDTVRSQAAKARIAMPEVGIYDSPEANAFATGPSRSNSLVAVSTGLLHTMTREEVTGVLAHEITHVSNGDMVTMTLLQGILNTFVIFLSRVFAFFLDRALSGGREERGKGSASSWPAWPSRSSSASWPAWSSTPTPAPANTGPMPAPPRWKGKGRCWPRCAA